MSSLPAVPPARQTPAPLPTAPASPAPASSDSPAPSSGGAVTIEVPAAQPVLCTPQALSLGVAQRAVITCTSAGFTGPIASTVADPTIATVALVAGTYTLFYVFGTAAGTTSVAFQTASGGTGQIAITVDP